MKTARREVRVARLDQLIPIGHLLVSLDTDPTNRDFSLNSTVIRCIP
jgi:hypothetical protein